MFQRIATPVRLNGHASAQSFFAPAVAADAGSLHVAHVDGAARCIHLASYARPEGADEVPVADILRDAAELGSAGLVVAHQHGQAPVPVTARANWDETRRLATAADLMQVTLLDHLVFQDRHCLSLRQLGVL